MKTAVSIPDPVLERGEDLAPRHPLLTGPSGLAGPAALRILLVSMACLTGCTPAFLCPGGRLPNPPYDGWEARLEQRLSDHAGRDELHLLVFGDSGKAVTFTPVARQMKDACAAAGGCDLALMLGDNIYDKGPRRPDDPRFEKVFHAPLADFSGLDVWGVLGNHGYRGCPQAQVEHTFLPPAGGADWLIPAPVYAVPGLPPWLTIVAIDTELLARASEARRREHLDRAAKHLRSADGWRLVIGHHPVYSAGAHGGSRKVRALRDLLSTALLDHADLYLAGHDHDQQLIATDGFDQVVSGAASKTRPQRVERVVLDDGQSVDPHWGASPGFALLTVDRYSLRVTFHHCAQEPDRGCRTTSYPVRPAGETPRPP